MYLLPAKSEGLFKCVWPFSRHQMIKIELLVSASKRNYVDAPDTVTKNGCVMPKKFTSDKIVRRNSVLKFCCYLERKENNDFFEISKFLF